MRNLLFTAFLTLTTTCIRGNNDLSINGNHVDKSVVEICFEDSGDTLHWSDNTKTCNKMADVMTRLACGEGIDKAYIASVSGIYDKKILVSGTQQGSSINIYDIVGNRLQHVPTLQQATLIDISHLNTGIYLLQDKNMVIKFIKR